MDEIMKEFQEKGILRGHTRYYYADDAIAIIQKCRKGKKRILGIDALTITEKTAQVVDYIDYTAGYYKEFDESFYFSKYHVRKNSDTGHWIEAEKWIKDRIDNGWVFEIGYEI
jgi:hypothetical protein